MPSLPKLDSTVSTLVIAALIAAVITAGVTYLPSFLNDNNTSTGGNASAVEGSGIAAAQTKRAWKASAPGRVRPKGGKVRIRAEVAGMVVNVLAANDDRVRNGDILVMLDTKEIDAKLQSAIAEVRVRLGERDEEPEKNKLMIVRRSADDALAAAERAIHTAQMAFDRVFLARRAGKAKDAEVETARKAIAEANKVAALKVAERNEVLAQEGMPAPTRLDSGLAIARSDLRIAEIAHDRTRVRAPSAGTVLRVDATVGEATSASALVALVEIGDMSSLEVRAEIAERDISKVSVDQSVVIRSNAFPGQEFTGKTISTAPALGSPALKAQGPGKQSDVDVLEVKIALDGAAQLMPGMRVDVFFKAVEPVKAAAKN